MPFGKQSAYAFVTTGPTPCLLGFGLITKGKQSMCADNITISPGREASRRKAIVQNVADALRESHHAASFGALLANASVSQEEVIHELGNNEALISAVAGTIAQRLMAPLAEPPTEASFIRQLVEFSRRATHEYSGLQVKNLYRILVSDTTHEPTIKGAMYRHGPVLVRRELAHFFSSAQSAGVRLEVDSLALATYFMASLRSYWYLSDMSGAADRAPCEREIGKLVEVFFSGIQAKIKDA
jgi:AcrR family transcriptional regulator